MFSNSTQYAIRTVLFLSRNSSNENKLKVQDIASELNIPRAFLSKILQQLSRCDIVSSVKGRGGGFYLNGENANKRLFDVVLCIDGHNVFDKCILGLPNCGNDQPCYLHNTYAEFKKGLQKIIKDVSIDDLRKDDLMKHYKL